MRPSLALPFLSLLVAVSAPCAAAPAAGRSPQIYAGGVAGVAALADAAASAQFRAAGGGLYLHNNGWAALTPEQQRATLRHFAGAPVALELGFGLGDHAHTWGKRFREGYLALGIKPAFIAANAFDKNNQPTAEMWRDYMTALRAAGVPETTLILPTFEYQNFRPNIPTLAAHTVTLSPVFQAIIRTAGGIVLDTPSGYTFGREAAYRDWVVDALRWTRAQGLKSVVIASPHRSKLQFAADTDRYLAFLRAQDASPDIVVVENYEPKPDPDYPNLVGPESDPATALGVGLGLLRRDRLLWLDHDRWKTGTGTQRSDALTALPAAPLPNHFTLQAEPNDSRP